MLLRRDPIIPGIFLSRKLAISDIGANVFHVQNENRQHPHGCRKEMEK